MKNRKHHVLSKPDLHHLTITSPQNPMETAQVSDPKKPGNGEASACSHRPRGAVLVTTKKGVFSCAGATVTWTPGKKLVAPTVQK